MKGHNTFYNSKQKITHKIVAAVMVDYLPGDIFAYTDRAGWINIFVKEEFYARTKSENEVKRIVNQVKKWLQTDFYDLKSPEAKREWDDIQLGIAARYKALVERTEDLEAELERAKDGILALRHEHPFHPALNPRKEN